MVRESGFGSVDQVEALVGLRLHVVLPYWRCDARIMNPTNIRLIDNAGSETVSDSAR